MVKYILCAGQCGAVAWGIHGGQEAELKAGSEVNMDEEGTGTPSYPPLPHSRPSLEYFSTRDVCVRFSTYSRTVSRMVLLL